MTLLILSRIITLLNNMWRNFEVQWFRLICQTRISLFPHHKRFLIYHRLDMSYFVRSSLTKYLSTSYKLMGSWYGLLVGVRRFYPECMVYSWTKISIFQVSPQEASLMRSSRMKNWG